MASSPLSDPSPYVLLGTLLFALAAAAGQFLRGDPTFFRRMLQRIGGRSGGGSGSASGNALSKARVGEYGAPEAGSPWIDGYDTTSNHGPATDPDLTQADLSRWSAPYDFAVSPEPAMTTAGHPVSGLGGSSGGLHDLSGGSSGGLDGFAKSAPSGLDGFAKGTPSGLDGGGFGSSDANLNHDLIRDVTGQGGDVAPDTMGHGGQSATRPTDWGLHGPSPAHGAPHPHAGGSLGGSNGSGGEFARGIGNSGSELAHGANGSGLGSGNPGANGNLGGSAGSDVLARGAGPTVTELGSASSAPPSGAAGSGLGGSSGGGSLARGLTPGLDLASMPSTVVPDGGLNGGLGGSLGGNAGAADALARSVVPPDPGVVASSMPSGVSPDPIGGPGGPGPAWLAAGALARAVGLDLADADDGEETRSQAELTRTYQCPGCGRAIVFGARFCGYCGEPLDKTLA